MKGSLLMISEDSSDFHIKLDVMLCSSVAKPLLEGKVGLTIRLAVIAERLLCRQIHKWASGLTSE